MSKTSNTNLITVSSSVASTFSADQSRITSFAAEKAAPCWCIDLQTEEGTNVESDSRNKNDHFVPERHDQHMNTNRRDTGKLTFHSVTDISIGGRKDMFHKMIRMMIATLAAICMMLSGMTVCAESVPTAEETSNKSVKSVSRTMTKGLVMPTPDGERFEPAYYAENNPDVVAVIGTDPTALYNHYLEHGKAEGRKPNGDRSFSMTEDEFAKKIIALVNQARAEAGVSALTESAILDKDASQRAYETSQVYSHTRPDGTPFYTLDPDHMYGENIDKTSAQASPEDVFAIWMNSAGHRANILCADYSCIGVGCYFDSTTESLTAVQNFDYGD